MFPINLVVKYIFRNSKTRHGHLVYNCGIDTVKMHLSIQSGSSLPKIPHVTQPLIKLSKSTPRKERSKAFKIKDNVLKKKKNKTQRALYLPWWFVYVAFVLAFAIVAVCGFFTILYSFNYGLEVSVKWLITLLFSFITDAFFAQPLKVLVIALVMSLFFKRSMEIRVEKDVRYFKKRRGGIKKYD